MVVEGQEQEEEEEREVQGHHPLNNQKYTLLLPSSCTVEARSL